MIKLSEMVKDKKKDDLAAKSAVKYRVNFGLYIPEMQKEYTKEALENDPEACAYLVEIGSQAVIELVTHSKNEQ
jgi:hypothetical protein